MQILQRSHGYLSRAVGAELKLANEVVAAALGPDLLKPKMSTSDQVFNFFPQLDAVICSVSMILVELTIFGIVPFCWV